jgi:hypothetical protein
MSGAIGFPRGAAAFPCGSWWGNVVLALPAVIFAAECCPQRARPARSTTPTEDEVPPESPPAPAPDELLIELVETWTTSRIVRVHEDGSCEIVHEGPRQRGPWRAVAFRDGPPSSVPASPVSAAELEALVAHAEAPPAPVAVATPSAMEP